jgi:uncharacterized protein with TPD motif
VYAAMARSFGNLLILLLVLVLVMALAVSGARDGFAGGGEPPAKRPKTGPRVRPGPRRRAPMPLNSFLSESAAPGPAQAPVSAPVPGCFGEKLSQAFTQALTWDGPSVRHPRALVAEAFAIARGLARADRPRFKRIDPGFGPARAAEVAFLATEANRLSAKYNIAFSAKNLASMRVMESALAAQWCGARIRGLREQLAKEYQNGATVLSLAVKHRAPPVAVLRQILAAAGYEDETARRMLSEPARMPPRLSEEAEAIFEADLGSRVNADKIRQRAQDYEDALGGHLRSLGLSFKTEQELRSSAAAAGKEPPLLTPDFLLDAPAMINGRLVTWIDAKAYPMYGSALVSKGLAKQAIKYTEAFGPGAMVFEGGVAQDARVLPKNSPYPEPLLLDGSHVRG